MRSSKKRSRSNQNRPRTLGNIINRVFDSSGPEGKVRGTPQQIIEKYQMLARDAQLSNDRVAAENFLQHAEHYTRMLAEAQREMAAEQEARQQQYQQNSQQNGNGGNGGNGNGGGNRDFRDRDDRRDYRDRDDRRDNREGRDFRDPGTEEQPMAAEVIDLDARAGDSGLVETPETRRREDAPEAAPREQQQRAPREGGREGGRSRDNNRSRDRNRREPAEQPELPAFITGPAPDPKPEAPADKPAAEAPAPAAEAAPAEKPRRAPRKPKAEGEGKKAAAE